MTFSHSFRRLDRHVSGSSEMSGVPRLTGSED
jgi:hypothetical protein